MQSESLIFAQFVHSSTAVFALYSPVVLESIFREIPGPEPDAQDPGEWMVAVQIPDWVQSIVDSYAGQEKPFQECEISSALGKGHREKGNLSEEYEQGFLSEWSAFLFGANRLSDSVWGIFFSPMMTMKKADGTPFHSPDIKDLDAEIIAHWEERAKSCTNPVMRARYADLVWDIKNTVTGQRPNVEFAKLGISSYLDAVQKERYTNEMFGVDWLARALQLARSIKDQDRIKQAVDLMFTFYDKIADVGHTGRWIFLFDILYGEKCISADQEARIIAQLETMFSKITDTNPSASGVYRADPFAAEAAADRLLRHYHKLNDRPNVERVMKAFGATFEDMVGKANPVMASIFLPRIIERYQQEGLKEDAERAQLLAQEKAKNIAPDMKSVYVESGLKKEDVDNLVAKLIQAGDPDTSFTRIAVYFMPDVDAARTLLQRLRTDAPFLSMIPVSFLDEAGNPRAVMGALDDDEDGRLYQQLGRSLQFLQPILNYTLEKFREVLHPSVDDVLAFLSKSPLFSNLRQELLRDGLAAYEQGDFVKAIHVLIPQVECALREFLGRLGVPTRKPARNHPGVNEAKNMNDILADPRMRAVLKERLWRYLTLVYVEKRGGLNLRNDVAHGLLDPAAFNRQIADYVLHTLLALSLVREKKKENGTGRAQ
jgi:lysyl-tRNA synthetase class 1